METNYLVPFFLVAALLPVYASAQAPESADELVAISLQTLQQIDAGEIEPLWIAAPGFVKALTSKEAFTGEVRNARKSYGTITERKWVGLERIRFLDSSARLPAGIYATADFSSALESGKWMFERISLRYEPDGWKVIGYVPRDK